MPIYEYHCRKCNKNHEVIHKVSEKAPKCPVCGSKMTKGISRSGFQLKGGGWYKDGYASSNAPSPTADSCSTPTQKMEGPSSGSCSKSKCDK